VKCGPLLVAEHHLWDPDTIPGVVFKLEHRAVVVGGRVETEPPVEPLLAQIHTQRIVLHQHALSAPVTGNISLSLIIRQERTSYTALWLILYLFLTHDG